MLEQRLTELEIKASYQEDLLQALNLTVASQQLEIAALIKTCRSLHEKLIELAHDSADNVKTREIPPHY